MSTPSTFLFCIITALLLLVACQDDRSEETLPLFFTLPPSQTNIGFQNRLTETDDFNIIEYLYFYNGGGVATGDINNDGLADIYFVSNQESNKLYLNRGNFKFDDITTPAGVEGIGNWKTGVTMADVNADGFLDIFVCGVGNYKTFDGRNQLLVNNGDLTFTDKTKEFGLAFQGFSTHTSFFDYDSDGDLDMYLLNHSMHSIRSYGDVQLRFQSDPFAGDKLYRNELVPSGRVRFTEVTAAAGIFNSQIGYGLGIGVSDLNLDGHPDLYVSNDFHENDYLYINRGDGTFQQELERSLSHSSRFSMGNDIADINNDGWADIISLDMLPKDEAVIKTAAGEDPYDIYQFKLRFGYHPQFARNCLQLNRGLSNDRSLIFSDIACLSGIEATDWSWSALAADFDHDGYKDVFIANGIARRPNDMDYINYITRDSAQRSLTDKQFTEKMPAGNVPNFFFRNRGDLTFEDVSAPWLGNNPDLSTGASYADLDNDGDLDLVVNNINAPAAILRNDVKSRGNYLRINLKGSGANSFGIGAKIFAAAKSGKIFLEQFPSRGWMSSVNYTLHLGLGAADRVDSVTVVWPTGKYQVLHGIAANQTIVARQEDAVRDYAYNTIIGAATMLRPARKKIPFIHKENDFNAFNNERLIPHMVSTQGPHISAGDINGDRLEDLFIGGAAGQPASFFIQERSENFRKKAQPAIESDSLSEDVASALFDADNNGSLDLIVAGGGQQFNHDSPLLLPRLYLNDGAGNFRKAVANLPEIFVDASTVKPADIDQDGDDDLFIGGRIVPGKYGLDPPSFILINNGKGVFSDETSRILPQAEGALGMVTDAAWHDFNNDGRKDLIITGEWMPITILIQNSSGSLEDKTEVYGLAKSTGWWNTITLNDFDHDGDMDFVAGNVGLNSRLRASDTEPVRMLIGDIDHNGSMDHILSYFNNGREYPFASRDQLVKQVPVFKRKFLKYESYKDVAVADIIPDGGARFLEKRAVNFASAYGENRGGKFVLRNLPLPAQIFPVFSILADDVDRDGNTDIIAVGNLFAVQPDIGRYDAGYGLVMTGDGKGNFETIPQERSGLIVKGEGRDIKTIALSNHRKLYVISRNNDSIVLYEN